MKHLIIVGALCLSAMSLNAGHRASIADMLDAMTLRMERQFKDMFDRVDRVHDAVEQAEKNGDDMRLDTYARNAVVSEDADTVRVSVSVDKNVATKDILIELDNGVLQVLVEKPERIEIVVEEHWLTMTAERRTSGSFSSVSCASQQLTLPSVVDVSTAQADLTDGTLTLTFQKNAEKNRQRIPVTEGHGKQGVAGEKVAEQDVAKTVAVIKEAGK